MYVPWGGGFDANYIIFSEMLKFSTIFSFHKENLFEKEKREYIYFRTFWILFYFWHGFMKLK